MPNFKTTVHFDYRKSGTVKKKKKKIQSVFKLMYSLVNCRYSSQLSYGFPRRALRATVFLKISKMFYHFKILVFE